MCIAACEEGWLCSIEGTNDDDYMNIIVTQREDIKPYAHTHLTEQDSSLNYSNYKYIL